jgi:hypothetical protein
VATSVCHNSCFVTQSLWSFWINSHSWIFSVMCRRYLDACCCGRGGGDWFDCAWSAMCYKVNNPGGASEMAASSWRFWTSMQSDNEPIEFYLDCLQFSMIRNATNRLAYAISDWNERLYAMSTSSKRTSVTNHILSAAWSSVSNAQSDRRPGQLFNLAWVSFYSIVYSFGMFLALEFLHRFHMGRYSMVIGAH